MFMKENKKMTFEVNAEIYKKAPSLTEPDERLTITNSKV